jgi:NADH:ubiquinone oxidoreductase subunit 2 (subunit N)
VAKYYLVKALFTAHHPALTVFAIINAFACVLYYGRVAVHAWKKPAFGASPLEAPAIIINGGQTIALTAAVFVSLAAGLYPEPFLRIARYAFGQ